MVKTSQTQKIVEFLKAKPNEKFTARQIAKAITSAYPEDYADKRENPRFADERSFITQIVAEIGSLKDFLIKKDEHIHWQDKPRPRIYWYDPERRREDRILEDIEEDESPVVSLPTTEELREHDLYPILMEYLKSEHKLYCQRIDERRSKNSRGSGGNRWLHPDIVAMQTIDIEWNELVRHCVKQGSGQNVRLWSFEVKKEINGTNVRESFFQTVSNSSWANEGYLVATSISSNAIEQELRMLSALHGIGVILLKVENPSESEMVLPARAKAEVDWQSVNRIVAENPDFKDYIELVSTYYQTGRVRKHEWNKI